MIMERSLKLVSNETPEYNPLDSNSPGDVGGL